MKRILLISNKVMPYRVSLYNYFQREFLRLNWEFAVFADALQRGNRKPLQFHFRELPLSFFRLKSAIEQYNPSVVILFLHLRDLVIWPLIHWLKLKHISFAFWTKGGNWDAADSVPRYHLFNYVHGLSDALILYSQECLAFVKPGNRHKAFIANNTINFSDFPHISESRDEIKKELNIPFEKVVLFVGRMDEGKGRKKVDHLIQIFSDLEREDIGLIIVGSGLSESLKTLLNRRNTRYLGEVYDPNDSMISKIFKMADICAIPGHVGLGLNQALYWGLPVVTEAGAQPPEISYLKPGRNGFIVAANDVGELRERIFYLLDNDSVRANFSKCARADILGEASVEAMFAGFTGCVEFLDRLNSLRRRDTQPIP